MPNIDDLYAEVARDEDSPPTPSEDDSGPIPAGDSFEPAPSGADDDEDWGPFLRKLGLGLAVAGCVVWALSSDPPQASAQRSAWMSSCMSDGGGDDCEAVSDQWHELCYYQRAAGLGWMDHLNDMNRRREYRHRREYDPKRYVSCMDEKRRDRVKSRKVDEMLKAKGVQ